jgi:hypothetical protein
LPEEPVRARTVRREEEDDDESQRPRPKRRKSKSKSHSKIPLIVGLAVGGFILLLAAVTVAVFLLSRGGFNGFNTYPDLTPDKFHSVVKQGMTEAEAVAALGPPSSRRPIAIRMNPNGAVDERGPTVKTDRIRLTWIIHDDGKSWSACTADLDRDGGTIVSTGHGSGRSN